MSEIILQCCYTNAVQEVGGTVSSGWQPVAVSGGIPTDAYNTCVSLQNANSTIQSTPMDDQGNALNLLEITGDGAYVYVSRTQYGLLDRLGRANMFSHAYIFPWSRDAVLTDPNVFLTLERSNFASDLEAAAPRASLERARPLDLAQAIAIAGMDGNAYLTLIRCVYAQFSDRKSAKPLYLQYDGSERQLQAILYCIYYGLPFFVRKNLAIASADSNSTSRKNLIFCRSIAGKSSYLVPATGENNLLNPRVERKIARYGFVDHVATRFTTVDANSYFTRLDALAAELGDNTASNELILKIAHLFIEGAELSSLSDEELDSRLSDALRSKSMGVGKMEAYISDMLDEIRRRRLFLTEETDANLEYRLSSPVGQRLAQAGQAYNIYCLSTLEPEAAARKLSAMSPELFSSYQDTLKRSEKGTRILDHYYAAYGLGGQALSWDALSELLAGTAYLSDRPLTLAHIESSAWDLYNSQLDAGLAPLDCYEDLMDLMSRLLPGNRLDGCNRKARELYWGRVSFRSLDPERIEEYRSLGIESADCKFYFDFLDTLIGYASDRTSKFLLELNEYYLRNRLRLMEENLLAPAMEKAEAWLRKVNPKTLALADWFRIAGYAETSDLFKKILCCREYLRKFQYSHFLKVYPELEPMLQASPHAEELRRLSIPNLLKSAEKSDAERPIPLDIWLQLGRTQCGNPFLLFDTMAPAVLGMAPDEVAGSSRLLPGNLCQDYAQEYLKTKGAATREVKAWLGELKQAEKRRIDEERRQQKEQDKAQKAQEKEQERQLKLQKAQEKDQEKQRSKGGRFSAPRASAPASQEGNDATFSFLQDSRQEQSGRQDPGGMPEFDSAPRRPGQLPPEEEKPAKKGLFGGLFGRKY